MIDRIIVFNPMV